MPKGTPSDPTPRVEVHRLTAYGTNEWECVFTAALVPGPARFCAVCGCEAGADAITIKPRDTERTVCGNCALSVRLTTQEEITMPSPATGPEVTRAELEALRQLIHDGAPVIEIDKAIDNAIGTTLETHS